MTRREHFVLFMSPGTMFDETTEKPIESWDISAALLMLERITERHGAKPYGFQFLTKVIADPVDDGEGGTLKVQPKTVAASGTHFVKGRLRTVDDIAAEADTKEQILLSNMRGNDWPIVCETTNGYRHTGRFEERDRLVGPTGEIVEAGDDPKHVEYRKRKIAEHRKEMGL